MSDHAIFFSWNRSLPGREQLSRDHFDEFVGWLSGQQQNGTIDSFIPVFLMPGGPTAVNGFFLIFGDAQKLGTMQQSEEWIRHTARAGYHLGGFRVVNGVTGEALKQQMSIWSDNFSS